MVYVRVFGRLLKSTGEPWAKGRVLFELDNGSWTSQNNYPQNPEKAIANQFGDFSISLWANGEGLDASRYRCILPDGDQFLFVLPPNFTEINLTVLREGHAIPLPGGGGSQMAAPVRLPVPALNTLSDLPAAPTAQNRVLLYVNGLVESPAGNAPSFSHLGTALTWNPTNAGYDLRTTYEVYAVVW